MNLVPHIVLIVLIVTVAATGVLCSTSETRKLHDANVCHALEYPFLRTEQLLVVKF